MAETKLAMSLDALIAQATTRREKKPKPQRPAAGPAPQSGPRKGLNKNRQSSNANGNGAQQQRPPKQQQQQQPQPQQPQQQQQPQQRQGGGQRNRKSGGANLGVRGGQVQKRTVIELPAKALRSPPQPVAPPRTKAYQQRQPAPDGKWQHDLYEDVYVPPRRGPAPQAAATSSKLIIKNLHHQVSTDDLLELFSTCGTVKSHGVNFDTSGRSIGTGWVVFETRTEAEVAKKEYNNVKLDGQPMNIYFSEEVTGMTIKKLSSGISVQKAGADGGVSRGGAGGSGGQRLAAAAIRETAAAAAAGAGASRGGQSRGSRGNRLRSAVVGRAQLDRDLQDYMQD